MRKIYPLFLVFVFVSASVLADEVTLKNGKVLRGNLVREDEEMILLEDSSGVQIQIKKSNIASTIPDEPIDKMERIQNQQNPKKEARVYRKEDLEKTPELSIVGTEESEDQPVQTRGSNSIVAAERTDEAYWNNEALLIDREIREAKRAYEKHKSVCDKTIPEITDLPTAVPVDSGFQEFEDRRRISCFLADSAHEDLVRAQEDYELLLEQARREGVPPGWVDPERLR